MRILDGIMNMFGMGKSSDTPPIAPPIPASQPPIQAGPQASEPPPAPKSISAVDVVAKLNALSASKPGLDWKHSIVDLLKLLGLGHDMAARKELAADLKYSGNDPDGSEAKNIWLHKAVLQKLADNGGNIPKELL